MLIGGMEYNLPTQRVTELDRLSFVVTAVEESCQLVPKGAYKLTPNNEIRQDETFNGLTIQNGSSLENYQHFREPLELKNREKIGFESIKLLIICWFFLERGEALMHDDFLDPVNLDIPKDSWSIQSDASKRLVLIQ